MKLNTLLPLLAAAALTACAGVTYEDENTSREALAKAAAAPDPNKAGIFVLRESLLLGDGIRLDVFLDGKCLGTTGPQVFLYQEVEGGKIYTLASESAVSPNELKVYLAGGRNYFYRQSLTTEGLISGIYTAKLTPLSAAAAHKALKNMRLGKSGQCAYDAHLNELPVIKEVL